MLSISTRRNLSRIFSIQESWPDCGLGQHHREDLILVGGNNSQHHGVPDFRNSYTKFSDISIQHFLFLRDICIFCRFIDDDVEGSEALYVLLLLLR